MFLSIDKTIDFILRARKSHKGAILNFFTDPGINMLQDSTLMINLSLMNWCLLSATNGVVLNSSYFTIRSPFGQKLIPQMVPTVEIQFSVYTTSRRASASLCTHLCQLSLVEAGSGLQLVVSLVASQRVHLQLEKVDLWTEHRWMMRGGHFLPRLSLKTPEEDILMKSGGMWKPWRRHTLLCLSLFITSGTSTSWSGDSPPSSLVFLFLLLRTLWMKFLWKSHM